MSVFKISNRRRFMNVLSSVAWFCPVSVGNGIHSWTTQALHLKGSIVIVLLLGLKTPKDSVKMEFSLSLKGEIYGS